ncbi:hypothetical protein Cgig2_013065 [Carnegiea gigantea]|uniref:Uncharacterized protein n=1 Tax=Carnegiea gigantea TaxID=171969 RepID=A0A9Q1KQZ0_9CARY|nr:hypothetical protein Cgig2_013065 [Carnegiea gigantea]
MGKRGGQKRETNAGAMSSSALHTSLSLREEASGRKQSPNPKSLLKLKHLQNLAEWATKEASIPSLGAFFGCRFTEFGEALGILLDPFLFPCRRNRAKRRRRHGKTNPPTQNDVVYTCSFCSHRNLKRGTPKGHMKDIRPSKSNLPSNLKSRNPIAERSDGAEKSNTEKVKAQEVIETSSPTTGNITSSFTESQVTPAVKLLDSNKSKRKKSRPKGSTDQSLAGSAPADTKDASGTNTSRKRRKSWTSLKEIAKNEELERNHRFQKTSNSISLVARDQGH